MMRLFSYFLLFTCILSLSAVNGKKVADCCCEAETIDLGNDHILWERLQALKQSTFFRTFKVNLYSECPFWQEHSQCGRRSCAVCGECGPEEIPPAWRDEKTDLVDRTISPFVQQWQDDDETLWIVQDNSKQMSYVNMLLNPESHTGYEGHAAQRIWSAIYNENCFKGTTRNENMCFEQRVFYRVISGLHSAISAHISASYPLDSSDIHAEVNNATVGPNVDVFQQKLGQHDEYLDNLYFVFVFLLRAVNKASPILLQYDYNTGNVEEDIRVREQIHTLLTDGLISHCTTTGAFDETLMFNDFETIPMKRQFQLHFRNISRIMDCVGCEKCKLHGKLQILGLGTAFKILFTDGKFTLSRNEVMALIHTLIKFSNALHIVKEMKWKLTQRTVIGYVMMIGIIGVVIGTLILMIKVCRHRMKKRMERQKRKIETQTKKVE